MIFSKAEYLSFKIIDIMIKGNGIKVFWKTAVLCTACAQIKTAVDYDAGESDFNDRKRSIQ